jgi:hypothetical protein
MAAANDNDIDRRPSHCQSGASDGYLPPTYLLSGAIVASARRV